VNRASQFVVGLLAGVLAAGLSGCAFGGDSASVDAGALEGIVLQQEDVPERFVSFDAGPLQAADQPRGGSGWKARYRRSGSPSTRGPLVIESRVDRFDDADAADESLAAVVRQARANGWSSAASPEVGDESHALRRREDAVTPVDYFLIAWRHANVVASVTVSGFADKVTLGEAVGLARAQQRRTKAAAA
jgi:hypothetical protein